MASSTVAYFLLLGEMETKLNIFTLSPTWETYKRERAEKERVDGLSDRWPPPGRPGTNDKAYWKGTSITDVSQFCG
jgi:hypothetical protein